MSSNLEEGNKRGPYRKYLKDVVHPIPRSTISRWKKLKTNQLGDEIFASSSTTSNENNDFDNICDDASNVGGLGEEELIEMLSVASSYNDSFKNTNQDEKECRIPFYEGSTMTQEEAEVLLMAFIIRFNLTDVALVALLNLLNVLFPFITLSPTKYRFFKRFFGNQTQQELEKKFFCIRCNILLQDYNDENESGKNSKMCCPECLEVFERSKLIEANQFFITLPLRKQLEDFVNGPLYAEIYSSSYKSEIRNGSYCEQLKNTLGDEKFSKDDLTLQFNTDGVNPFKSSKNSLWPILVCVNELPYVLRRKNIMLCGLWFNSIKPNMHLFLSTLVEELKSLHNEGILVNNHPSDGQQKRIRAHLILCSVDSVARPLIQNIHQFNGSFGCSFCLHEGEVIEIGAGHTRVYPASSTAESRTLRQHFRDCRKSIHTGTPVNGVKGPCILSYIPTFDVTQCFSTDYLHNILLGVVNTFAQCWFNSTNHNEKWYIGRPNQVEVFDYALLQIKPPCEITRTPRSIGDMRNLYKGSEWKNFLLYYSFPILEEIKFPKEFLSHWSLLVHGIYIFLKPTLNAQDIEEGERLLHKFVTDINKLYGKALYKFNVHLILHIPECVRKFGPLWAHSTFCYEHCNGVLKEMFHNSKGVPQQICSRFLQHRQAENLACRIFADPHCPTDVKKLIGEFLYDFKSYYNINISAELNSVGREIDGVTCIGVPKKNDPVSESLNLAIRNVTRDDFVVEQLDFFASCISKGMTIHASDNVPTSMSKRVNSFVKLDDDRIVAIQKIVRLKYAESDIPDRVFFEVKHFEKKHVETSSLPHKLGTIYTVVEEDPSAVIVISPRIISQKCIAINSSSRNGLYVIPLVNNVERD